MLKVLMLFVALLPSAPAALHESPFACNLSALTAVQRKRQFDELSPALRARRIAVHELANGYEFRFLSDRETVSMLTEWIGNERLCCPFFDFDLRVSPEGGPVSLRLTGRKGTKEFIRVDGAAWIR